MSKPAFALWLTGLPASGKTTLANHLAQRLAQNNIQTQILDSDQLRKKLTPNPTYSLQERDQFYRTLTVIAQMLTSHGIPVIIAATGHKQAYRDDARQQITHFIEVYVKCPLAICIERDQKGTYQKAQEGKATSVPGLQVPYEPPVFPELTVDTENEQTAVCVQRIINYLSKTCPLLTAQLQNDG